MVDIVPMVDKIARHRAGPELAPVGSGRMFLACHDSPRFLKSRSANSDIFEPIATQLPIDPLRRQLDARTPVPLPYDPRFHPGSG